MKSQTLGDMNTNVQYDKPMPSKEKMKTGDCCGNRRGEKIGSEESSIRTWNRREKFTGSEESSRKVYRVRGFVDQEWKSSTRTRNRRPGPRICRPGVEIVDQVRDFIDRVRGFVDQDDEIVDQVRDFIDRVQVFDFFLAPVSCNARDPQ